MNFRISHFFLMACLSSCSWKSHVSSYNYHWKHHSNPKEFTVVKKDTILPEKTDSLIVIDQDTIQGIFKKPTNHYKSTWFDSKGRKYRSGLFYTEYMIQTDTTFYKNGKVRSIQMNELCYLCKNWPYYSQQTIYYDRQERALFRTLTETENSYKQYYSRDGKLLDQKYTWPIFSTNNS